MSKKITKKELASRAELAIEVYDVLFNMTESFEKYPDISYMLGSILKGISFDVWIDHHSEYFSLLYKCFKHTHPIWNKIDLVDKDGKVLSNRLKKTIISGRVIDPKNYRTASPWCSLIAMKDKNEI